MREIVNYFRNVKRVCNSANGICSLQPVMELVRTPLPPFSPGINHNLLGSACFINF
jgi:hypothetical protein